MKLEQAAEFLHEKDNEDKGKAPPVTVITSYSIHYTKLYAFRFSPVTVVLANTPEIV